MGVPLQYPGLLYIYYKERSREALQHKCPRALSWWESSAYLKGKGHQLDSL